MWTNSRKHELLAIIITTAIFICVLNGSLAYVPSVSERVSHTIEILKGTVFKESVPCISELTISEAYHDLRSKTLVVYLTGTTCHSKDGKVAFSVSFAIPRDKEASPDITILTDGSNMRECIKEDIKARYFKYLLQEHFKWAYNFEWLLLKPEHLSDILQAIQKMPKTQSTLESKPLSQNTKGSISGTFKGPIFTDLAILDNNGEFAEENNGVSLRLAYHFICEQCEVDKKKTMRDRIEMTETVAFVDWERKIKILQIVPQSMPAAFQSQLSQDERLGLAKLEQRFQEVVHQILEDQSKKFA